METSVPENAKQFSGTWPSLFSKLDLFQKDPLLKVKPYVKLVDLEQKTLLHYLFYRIR